MNTYKELAQYGEMRRKGYTIDKKHIDKDTLKSIKKALSIKKLGNANFTKFEKPVPVFAENDKKLFLPRHWAEEHIGKAGKNFIANGVPFVTENLKTTFPPRDYQNEIVEKVYEQLKKKKGGIITVGCGKGKTFMAIYIATLLKQKTMIIVHTTVLMDQWKERLAQFTPDAKVGIIKAKKFEVEGNDFVICMLQTLTSKSRGFTSQTFKDFGLTVVDETHHIAAPSFSKALPLLSSKYKLGLSATPKRADGLENIFYWYIGPSAWYDKSINTAYNVHVKCIKYTSDTYVEIRQTFGKRSYDLHKMLELILDNKVRDTFIINNLDHYAKTGRQILVLSNRRAHLETLKGLFDVQNKKEEITTGFYMGGMKTNELAVSSMCNILFATYSLASEGMDIPTLNTLFMVSPRKEVEQIVGRIMRKKWEHEPLVFDICDDFSCFSNQGKYRQRYYKKNKYNQEIVYINDKIASTTIVRQTKNTSITKFLKKKEECPNEVTFDKCMFSDNED